VGVFGKFSFQAESVFNSVSTEQYRFRQRTPLRPVFLSNRDFDELYNVGCILRAFQLIQKKFPAARLTVAGDGEERPLLEKLTGELNLKNVEFLGSVAPETMPALYDASDIYLNSPNIDNMPSSVIEAFACGLPVVSTGVGGIPFIVENGETGLLVGRNDHEAIAREAIRLLEDDDFAQKIIAKAHRECVKYSWANVRGEWLKVYKELASEK
jgi:glycosyltransferase involved in cell wall biosynthesis